MFFYIHSWLIFKLTLMQHTHTQNTLDVKPKKSQLRWKKSFVLLFDLLVDIRHIWHNNYWHMRAYKTVRKCTGKSITKVDTQNDNKMIFVLFQCGKINWLWNWKAWIGRTIKEFKLKYNWRFPGHANYSAQLFYLTIKNSGS